MLVVLHLVVGTTIINADGDRQGRRNLGLWFISDYFRVNSDILIYGGPSITLEIMDGFWNFFFKHIRILPHIHCHHLQLNPRSVEASEEMETSGVNISIKWNSQNGSMVFLGSPKGP